MGSLLGSLGVGGRASGGGGPTVYLRADFAGVGPTNLSAYTPEVGPAFTIVAGTWLITASKLRDSVPAILDRAYADAGHSDFTCSVNLSSTQVLGVTDDDAYLMYRVVDQTNYLIVGISQAQQKALWWSVVNGIFTSLGSTTYNPGSGTVHALKVVVAGSATTITIDGAPLFSGAVGDDIAATRCGVLLSSGSTPAGTATWDHLLVTA